MNASQSVPLIFDRTLLAQRLRRARKIGPANFLLDRAVEDVLDRLAVTMRPFPRVVDIATPTQALARAVANTGAGRAVTRLVVPDEQPADGDWTLVAGDAENMPFAPESFDLAVSAFALQWVNDLPGVLIQIRRMLAPDGLFLGCLIGGQTLQELRSAFAEAEADILGGVSPHVAPFADMRDLGALLQRAGFALPVTDTDTLTARYDSMFALMADLRAMAATNILTQRSRRFLRRDVLMRAAEIYAARFADADGRVRATFEILWLSGWAPHESQQKPLKPGSAQVRLSDVLPARDYGGNK